MDPLPEVTSADWVLAAWPEPVLDVLELLDVAVALPAVWSATIEPVAAKDVTTAPPMIAVRTRATRRVLARRALIGSGLFSFMAGGPSGERA
ncbi:MAG: hypothetical protein ABIN79_07860 [Marmoricola sp.]